MQEKIKSLTEIEEVMTCERMKDASVVHCHGVFDLLHPGHVRHLQEAKALGDCLVVSITPDRFVNKGPGRPVFAEMLRMQQLAALSCVDYVVLNETPDAVAVLQKIKPDIYVKGKEYQDHSKDVTGKIVTESEMVAQHGGRIHYSDGVVFSSSALLNQHFDQDAQRLCSFLDRFKAQFSLSEILEKIEALTELKVLVIGDAILDEYQYVQPLGQAGKGVHMTARCLDREVFLGGSLIIANHLAQFAGNVTLLSAVGKTCAHRPWIEEHLASSVKTHFIEIDDLPTLTKRRYVLKDGETITKLFETYSSNEPLLTLEQTEETISTLKSIAPDFDLVLVADFGNGFLNPPLISALSDLPTYLAVNTQTNSGNRGYNVITHYPRADFISLNEPELRLAAHDRECSVASIAQDIAMLLSCKQLAVTRGVQGLLVHTTDGDETIPALTSRAIDRIGAGDSFFALASLCAAKGYPPLLGGFLGSVAAAIGVQIVGNREAIKKVGLCKYVTRLLK